MHHARRYGAGWEFERLGDSIGERSGYDELRSSGHRAPAPMIQTYHQGSSLDMLSIARPCVIFVEIALRLTL